jgi:YD repeat-containing protein
LRQNGLGRNPPVNNGGGLSTTFNTSGQGQIAGSIQTSFEYDGNSNQIAMVDDRGGITRWAFDSHDPDGSGFRGSAEAARGISRRAVPLNR